MSVKLTDAQLVMMSAAAQREDRCLPAPETMKSAVVGEGAKLVKLGFAREIHAKSGTPLWRRDETGRSFALKLTAAGLKAIAVDEGSQDAIEPGVASPQLPEAKNGVSLDDVGRHAPSAAPRDGSKLALMIDLLRRADGATIVDLTEATGWLAHTTRAAITGLRKRGYAVARERSDAGKSVYRMLGAPDGSGDRVAVQTEAVDGRRDPKPKTEAGGVIGMGPTEAKSGQAAKRPMAATPGASLPRAMSLCGIVRVNSILPARAPRRLELHCFCS